MKTTDWILEPGGFIYQVNNAGTNVFSFQVQGGTKDDGTRITVEDKVAIARRIFTAVNTFDQTRAVLKMVVKEVECYCTEGTANKQPCAHCEAVEALAAMEATS